MEDIMKHRAAVEANIEKAFNGGVNLNEELEKARSGVYADTAENRKLARVGQQYGGKKQNADDSDNEDLDKKKHELEREVSTAKTMVEIYRDKCTRLRYNVKKSDGSKKEKYESELKVAEEKLQKYQEELQQKTKEFKDLNDKSSKNNRVDFTSSNKINQLESAGVILPRITTSPDGEIAYFSGEVKLDNGEYKKIKFETIDWNWGEYKEKPYKIKIGKEYKRFKTIKETVEAWKEYQNSKQK